MTRAVAGLLAAVLTLGACADTYIDTEVTVPDTAADTTTTTLSPIDPNAPIADLLAEIEALMFDLDQQIIDRRGDVATLARIDLVWQVAERQIRAENPDDVYNFQQAIDLARSGVQRRRPADASKGYKNITTVIDAYLETG